MSPFRRHKGKKCPQQLDVSKIRFLLSLFLVTETQGPSAKKSWAGPSEFL